MKASSAWRKRPIYARERQRRRANGNRSTGAVRGARRRRAGHCDDAGRTDVVLERLERNGETDAGATSLGFDDARPVVNGVQFPPGLRLERLRREHPRRRFRCGEATVAEHLGVADYCCLEHGHVLWIGGDGHLAANLRQMRYAAYCRCPSQ